MRELAFTIVVGVAVSGCGDTSEIRCMKAYILIDDHTLREYERYYSVAHDYGYFFSEVGIQDGDREFVYRIDRNNYLYRSEDVAKAKSISLKRYLATCDFFPSQSDTLYLLVPAGNLYAEYLVRARYALHSQGHQLILERAQGSELLMDFSLGQGISTIGDDGKRIEVRRKSEYDCHKVYNVTSFRDQDSVNQIFIKGIGLMHRRDTVMDYRLHTVNKQAINSLLQTLCD